MNKIGEDNRRVGFNSIEVYLKEIGRTPLLTRKEERRLARLIKRGDPAARTKMIKANLRLVVKIANDYGDLGLPLLDLISEGNIGLMKAVEHFNPKKGAKFSTYASWWIKQAVRRALSKQAKIIRLPVHITEKVSKLKRARFNLEERLGRKPTPEELATVLGVSSSRVEYMGRLMLSPLSLDQKTDMGDENSCNLGEVIEDANAPMPSDQIEQKMQRAAIDQILGKLTEREREIMILRFGLDGRKPQTLEMVGRHFRVTRERIRQVQEIALGKLRRKYIKLIDGNGHNGS
jgi:RNA polymerase primary sigma factor